MRIGRGRSRNERNKRAGAGEKRGRPGLLLKFRGGNFETRGAAADKRRNAFLAFNGRPAREMQFKINVCYFAAAALN